VTPNGIEQQPNRMNDQNNLSGMKIESSAPIHSAKKRKAAKEQKEKVSLTTQFDKAIWVKLREEAKKLGLNSEQDVIRLAVGLYFERKG
jgi:hypothetical protein